MMDHIHIGVTALLWLGGLVYIAMTMHKVGKIRRVAYILALPVWATFLFLYAAGFLAGPDGAELTRTGIMLRLALFGIALQGFLIPFVDRLEAQNREVEIRLRQVNHHGS